MAAKSLNLREHFAGPADSLASISLPVDLEAHKGNLLFFHIFFLRIFFQCSSLFTGSDGRYYLLDAARLMPPEPPTAPGSHLYRLLRHELVRLSPVPLCADAYTKFIEHDPKKRCVFDLIFFFGSID